MPALSQETQPTTLVDQPVPTVQDAPDGSGAENETSPKDSHADQLASPLDKIEAAIRDIIAQQREAQADPPANHELRDLYAQESMARWTEGMFWAAVVATIFTALGLYLLWRTMRYTRDAAHYARDTVTQAERAAKAAEETIIATREIGQAQVRAYMAVYECMLGVAHDSFPEILFRFKNTGQTPARNVHIQITASPKDKDGEAPYSFGVNELSGEIIPGASGAWDPKLPEVLRNSSPPTIRGAFQSAAFVVFAITIEYDDVFGERRTEKYETSVAVENSKRGRASATLTRVRDPDKEKA